MNAPPTRSCSLMAAVLSTALAAAGCSTKQTSPAELCDNGGTDLIAFASDRGHHGQYDLYLYDIEGGGYRLLRNLNSATVSDSSPSLSGDGQLIAFVSPRGASGTDILMYARASCSFVGLQGANSTGNETDPAFSGDISRLLFVRDTLGSRRIRMVTAGTVSLVPLPGLDTLATFHDWSPAPDRTGDNLVFVSDREASPHLYLYERAARRVDTLLVTRGADGIELDPSVTPDGHYLCFASNRSGGHGGFDIYLYDLTTRQPVPLPGVNSARDERHPSINSAGTMLAYQSDSSAAGSWSVRFYYVGVSSAPHTIARMDTTANDVEPSVVFP
jgi:Tol biopolymer transport system component